MDGFGGEAKIIRRSDNHHPTVWGDHFLAYAHLSVERRRCRKSNAVFYTALLHLYKEVENELAKENKSFRVNFPISEMKKLARAYLQEAEWYHGNTIPIMEEYMKNGIETSVIPNLTAASWLGMGDEVYTSL